LETPEGSDRLDIPVVHDVAEAGVDGDTVVMLCVKSQHTVETVAALAHHAPETTPIVSVQNGVANEPTALRWFSNVYGIAVMCPTLFLEPGVVCAYSTTPTTGILDIGRYPEGVDETCSRVAGALSQSRFLSLARPDIMRWKYRKLLTNLGNAVDALCGPSARNGRLTRLTVEEGERVLAAAGIEPVPVAEEQARRSDHIQWGTIGGRPRPGGSTWQSLRRAAGTTEVDYLSGEIILLGRAHGAPTPVNSLLRRLLRDASARSAPPGQMAESQILAMLQ
jgi:2-dehydropantoate 2-reductase